MALRVFPCTYHCCPLEFCTHLLLNENDTAKWADKTTTGCCLTASHSLIGRAFVVKVIYLFLIKIKFFLLIIRHPLRILLLGPIIKLPPPPNLLAVTIRRGSRAHFLAFKPFFLGHVHCPVFYPMKHSDINVHSTPVVWCALWHSAQLSPLGLPTRLPARLLHNRRMQLMTDGQAMTTSLSREPYWHLPLIVSHITQLKA